MPNRRRAPANISKKNDFGGYTISFEGRTETMEEIMGDRNLIPGTMLKILWNYAKANGLTSKSRPYAPTRILKRDRVPQVAQP